MAERATVVLGTRPEAIKLAPVIAALQARGVATTVVSTGQHREMLEPMLELFAVRPDTDLALQRPGQAVTDVVAAVLRSLPPVFEADSPEVVIVQGDTATAFAAAFAAFLGGIDVAHVEAGLRTPDPHVPFPEEMNRRLVGRIARLHFAPTARAAATLEAEGIDASAILVTGNPVVDALAHVRREHAACIAADLDRDLGPLARNGARIVAVTGHRRESFGEPMRRVCHALRRLVEADTGLHVVFPVHLNPRVLSAVHAELGGHERIHLLEPLGYPSMIGLLERACAVITDSGGIQEEAPSLGTPVLVTREETERPEGVDAGCATVVGTDVDAIVTTFARVTAEGAPRIEANPYGDGRAGERIADAIAALD